MYRVNGKQVILTIPVDVVMLMFPPELVSGSNLKVGQEATFYAENLDPLGYIIDSVDESKGIITLKRKDASDLEKLMEAEGA